MRSDALVERCLRRRAAGDERKLLGANRQKLRQHLTNARDLRKAHGGRHPRQAGPLANAGETGEQLALHAKGASRVTRPVQGGAGQELTEGRCGLTLPGLLRWFDGASDRVGVEQGGEHFDALHAVDGCVVNLLQKRYAIVGKTFDHPHFPQRMGPVERTSDEASHQFTKLLVVAGRCDGGFAHVEVEIEIGVVDPVRMIESERDRDEFAAQNGQHMEPLSDRLHQRCIKLARRPILVDCVHGKGGNVSELPGRLDTEEAGVESGQLAHRLTVPRRLLRCDRALPTDDMIDLAALHVVHESGHDLEGGEVRLGRQQIKVFTKGGGVIVDGEEPEVGARTLAQFLIGDPRKAAFSVLHDDDGVDPKDVRGQRQTAQHIFGDATASIAQHVGLTEVKTQRGEHIDASIHTGDNGQVTTGFGVSDSSPCCGVSVIGSQQRPDLCHGVLIISFRGHFSNLCGPVVTNRTDDSSYRVRERNEEAFHGRHHCCWCRTGRASGRGNGCNHRPARGSAGRPRRQRASPDDRARRIRVQRRTARALSGRRR